MKNKIILLLMLCTFLLIPRSVYAQVIELTQEDFDNAYNTGENIKGLEYHDGAGYCFDSGEYKLATNITLGNNFEIYIPEESNVILDFNGKTIGPNVLLEPMGGNLTIKGNGTFNGSLLISDESNVIVENGAFNSPLEAQISVAITDSATVKIKDGVFNGTMFSIAIQGSPNVEITKGTFNGGGTAIAIAELDSNASLKLSGGTFKVTSNEGFGAITIVGDYTEEQFLQLSEMALASGYKYSDDVEYNQINTENFGVVTHSQKEISVIPIEGEYAITKGANQTFNNKDLTITCNGDIDLFEKLLVDNKEVDTKNYTVKSGSTIVTLKSDYIKTLSAGSHTVTFVYTNGNVSTALSVSNNPKTLDNIYTYILMLISSIIMLVINKKVFE